MTMCAARTHIIFQFAPASVYCFFIELIFHSTPATTMIRPVLFAAALLGVCTAASPLAKRDSNNDSPCFNGTIRKEYLLKITTYQPYDPYNSVTINNVNQFRLYIADPTN
jgi:hypothetical protein